MNKWTSVKREHTNDGIELTVSCDLAGVSRHALVAWDENPDRKIEDLINEIQEEVIGDVFDPRNVTLKHSSNRDPENLTVTQIATYEPLGLSIEVACDDSNEELGDRQRVVRELMELVWETQIKKRFPKR